MPDGEAPARFTAQPAAVQATVTYRRPAAGDGGTECPYYLCCQDALVAEVLPYPVTSGGEFAARLLVGAALGRGKREARPARSRRAPDSIPSGKPCSARGLDGTACR